MPDVISQQVLKQIRDCVVEVTFIDGAPIPFTSVDAVNFTWGESRGLAQGYSAARRRTAGISFLSAKDADAADVTVVECSLELYNRLQQAWDNDERIDLSITFNNSKDRIVFNNAEIINNPAQTSIGIGRDTIQFHLIVNSFDVEKSFS